MTNLIETENQILSIGSDLLPEVARAVRDGEELTATERYEYQAWLAEQIERQWQECECAACTSEGSVANDCAVYRVSCDADAARDASRDAWLDSDEQREYQLGGDSWQGTGEVITSSPEEIKGELDDLSRDGWDDVTETFWVRNWAQPIDPVTGESIEEREIRVTVSIDPDEPECEDGEEHDWQSPYEVLGGLKENPGVWGKGGGVVCKEVCARCGAYKITDTWAQDRSTGQQGLTSVRYEDADDASLAWIQERQ